MTAKSDLPQGTLDLLILKVVALGRCTGMRSRALVEFVAMNAYGYLFPRAFHGRHVRFEATIINDDHLVSDVLPPQGAVNLLQQRRNVLLFVVGRQDHGPVRRSSTESDPF
jgi:hypothetical protein